MKTRNLFLLGLAATMLAGCGGAKDYKNEVTKEVFSEFINNLIKDNPLFNFEKPYSFTFKMNSVEKNSSILLMDGKELSKSEDEVESETEVNFDSLKPAASITSNSIGKKFGPGNEEEGKFETNIVFQGGNNVMYEVDKLSKTYDEDETEEVALEIFEEAMDEMNKIIQEFTKAINISDKAKYYADKDVYTIVNEYTDVQTDHNDSYKEIYQIVVNIDSLEYYRKSEIELKKLNYTTTRYTEKSAKLVKKNVSVDTVDLKDYMKQ